MTTEQAAQIVASLTGYSYTLSGGYVSFREERGNIRICVDAESLRIDPGRVVHLIEQDRAYFADWLASLPSQGDLQDEQRAKRRKAASKK